MIACSGKNFLKNGTILDCDRFDYRDLEEGLVLYEVIRVMDGFPLFLSEHIERLKSTCSLKHCRIWLSDIEIRRQVMELIHINDKQKGNIRMIFCFREEDPVFISHFVEHRYPPAKQYENGVDVMLYEGVRENPNAKVLMTKFRARVNDLLNTENVFEVVLHDETGRITEGSRSNIFFIEGSRIVTVPVSQVLPGITREKVIGIIQSYGWDFHEKEVRISDLKNFETVFLTGTSPKVIPVRKLNGHSYDPQSEILEKVRLEYDRLVWQNIEIQKKLAEV